MANYETVSAKIPTELKEKINKYSIPISETIREALESEVRKKEIEDLKKSVNELQPLLDKFTTEEIVQMIREDRER